MRFAKLLLLLAGLGIIAGPIFSKPPGNAAPPKIRVQIQVIADSSNSLQANIEVPAGTAARDLMERLFKISYVDFSHRFVNGIAGFMIGRGEKKFWRLEIDGKDAEVGIAEIKINNPMQLRWVITAYK